MSITNPIPLPYIEYRPAIYVPGKVSYVEFYVIDPNTQKMKRIRMKMNRIDSSLRKKEAARIVANINARLAIGWNPLVEKNAPRSYHKLMDVFDTFITVKNKELEACSMRCYRSYMKYLKEWCGNHGIGKEAYVISFDSRKARVLMDEIEANDKFSIKTYNNYLTFFMALFNWMKEKQYISDNPFEGIRKKSNRGHKKNRRNLTEDEIRSIMVYLQQENPRYLAACLMCYCCLMRPNEIVQLRCNDIDLEKQTVRVRSEIAKNDNTSYRTIPNAMMPFVRCLDLSHKDWYVFGDDNCEYSFRPSNRLMCSRKVARYWNEHVRRPLKLPMEAKFYSLKDSGVTNMLSEGIPISFVQQQADHSSVAMTAIYLGKDTKRASTELKEANIITGISSRK